MYSQRTPCFYPQKEFPEILGDSNKSLALRLIHTILVSDLGRLRDLGLSIHLTNLPGSRSGIGGGGSDIPRSFVQ